MLKVIPFGKSDIGLRRSNNEDVFIVQPDKGFFLVGDGMGGAAAGEVASRIFAETALEIFSESPVNAASDVPEIIKDVFRSANERILNKARENPEYHGMGCTGELVFFYDQKYFLGHVGDSRSYLFRQGSLRQITRDHSLVQEQLDQGLITTDETKKHSLRNVILRAVGIKEVLEIDLIRGNTLPQDIFLLCSDGLSDMVDDLSLQEILSLPLSLGQKVEKLIDLAKSAGGYDNITIILCEIVSSP
jgi:protein phosphatase